MNTYLEFEKPIEQLDNKVHELKSLNDNAPSDNLLEEITQVEEQINETYKNLIRQSDNSKENQYLKDSLTEAKWFIKSLESRNETLLKVFLSMDLFL